MASYLDLEKLANLIRHKRLNRGLREVAAEIGNVSISTLSRAENGKTLDMETFLALCDWLEVPPAELIKNTEEAETVNTPEAIAIRLRTDPNIDRSIGNALATLVEAAYRFQK